MIQATVDDRAYQELLARKSSEIVKAHVGLCEYLRSEHLLSKVKDAVKSLMEADTAAILIGSDEDDYEDQWAADETWQERRPSYAVMREARRKGSFEIQDISSRDRSKSQQVQEIISCIACVLDIGGSEFGMIYCDVRFANRRFKREDGLFLQTLALQFEVYLELVAVNKKFEQLKIENDANLEEKLRNPMATLDSFVGRAEAISKLKKDVMRIGQYDDPVLILGETGTGKGVLARAIHYLSPRASKKMISVNCANLEKDLVRSELFGYEKGAFTGAAVEGKQGIIVLSKGGTLFLDEIGDLPLEIQGKLLDVIQEKKFRPLGSAKEIDVDFRLIAATNKDLHQMVLDGMFREDLYARLSDFPLFIPPLRTRKDDIAILAQHFAQPNHQVSKEALDYLMSLDFPQNVRELEKLINAAKKYYAADSVVISLSDLQNVMDRKRSAVAATHQSKEAEALTVSKLIMMLNFGELTFAKLTDIWDKREITAAQLREFVKHLMTVSGSKGRAADKLGLKTFPDKNRFYSWLRYIRDNFGAGE